MQREARWISFRQKSAGHRHLDAGRSGERRRKRSQRGNNLGQAFAPDGGAFLAVLVDKRFAAQPAQHVAQASRDSTRLGLYVKR